MLPLFPESLRMASLRKGSLPAPSTRDGSLRKIAASPLRGSGAIKSSTGDGPAVWTMVRPFVSGEGNWAFAMAAARSSSSVLRRSSVRRSTRVPHMPQNFMPGSLLWPHPAHFVLPAWLVRRSTCRLSMRTPQVPQNLYSGRFSVPQKVHSMSALNSFERWLLAHTSPKTAAQLFNKMTSMPDKLQGDFIPLCSSTNPGLSTRWQICFLWRSLCCGLRAAVAVKDNRS
jgi:hypothetical protein